MRKATLWIEPSQDAENGDVSFENRTKPDRQGDPQYTKVDAQDVDRSWIYLLCLLCATEGSALDVVVKSTFSKF